MDNNIKNVNINFSLPTVLTLIFIVLKLMGYIDWKWVWVLSPLWIGFSAFILLILILIIIKKVKNR